ncbi:Ras- protein Rab-40B [Saguinus oedipus]|uniref:small monomeric GTPase n=1 Tax=Saguinus oedipus TaxID=9490 RepID=A0ABQ9VTJ2_SAGOE|nr:Ras- protein Rab-40B [Saguinus oedipus]
MAAAVPASLFCVLNPWSLPQGVILVYDIANRWSFDGIDRWIKEIEEHAPGVPKILVGNRLHLAFKRQVPTEQAQAYAERLGVTFFEVSPLCNFNITESFTELARIVLLRHGMDRLWRPSKGRPRAIPGAPALQMPGWFCGPLGKYLPPGTCLKATASFLRTRRLREVITAALSESLCRNCWNLYVGRGDIEAGFAAFTSQGHGCPSLWKAGGQVWAPPLFQPQQARALVLSLQDLCCRAVVSCTPVHLVDKLPLPIALRSHLKSFSMANGLNARMMHGRSYSLTASSTHKRSSLHKVNLIRPPQSPPKHCTRNSCKIS